MDETRRRNEERKRALEAKRKRLEEMRRSKRATAEAASTTREPSAGGEAAPAAAAAAQGGVTNAGEKPPRQPQQEQQQQTSDEGGNLDNLIESLLSAPSTEQDAEDAAQTQDHSATPTQDQADDAPRGRGPIVSLKRVTQLGTVNVALREVDTYDKGTQTDPLDDIDDNPNEVDGGIRGPGSPTSKRRSWRGGSVQAAPSPSTPSSPRLAESAATMTETTTPEPPSLDEEERTVLEAEPSYTNFLNQSVRVVERAMKQNSLFDITIDYGGLESNGQSEAERITLSESISDERWSRGRTVTDIQWSPHHKELFLAAYTKRMVSSELDWARGASDPSGVVLIWSTHMSSERPEYVFTCPSPVHAACFHPYSANLVIGGTYSGQIVLWDMRAKSVPVQRSLLSPESHTHPVYSMTVTGSANAHNLVSVSTDGRLCVWNLANISAPTDSRQLKYNKKDVTATSLAFADGETNELFVGAEDGRLFRAQVHGTKAGVQSQTEAHFGPVTKMHFHKGTSATADLMLSASMDWTVKLWSHRSGDKPLACFEGSEDYVFDVKWSPVHPSVFATVNGAGMLDVWNINVDLEVPQARFKVPLPAGAQGATAALASLQWAPSGRKVLAGDARGNIHVFDLAADLANPRRDEWARLETSVADLVDEMASA
ncbi:Cytoplasmic dynein 1 intermediate chain 2 [Hondaea fermentalgiana]|uniref:Cytoplasmic dynein 1 intermediate chain 2 n=1 Tax=Hondaea fermentalgiana TaxID=2315210 RepID=A0A2R5G024_9STRA|nr:Cytoplasmic dynein 1 intermediate chain 2 [Hondaea fermentalgiana]|eukprot:GBG24376.1 Cytoplasmic dynein 1 intermediate chain 2 [Hondaea fermentalgiana]